MAARPTPAQPPSRVQITVADALALPVLRAGLPRVVAGARALDRPLRWVHAGEVPNMADMLAGGELLLSTGMGIGRRVGDQRQFVAQLSQRRVAALVIELGSVFAELPPALVAAAEQHELPLVELHSEVRFVAVTQAIHTEIVNAHHALLERGEEIQRELTRMLLDGEPIPEVLGALAAIVANPVFVEHGDARLLYHAAPSGSTGDPHSAWAAHARDGAWPGAVSARIELGTHDAPWRLVALPLETPLDALAAVAVERAAAVLSLALLRARHEQELLARERGDLLAELADGRVNAADAERRARALGWTRSARAALVAIAAEVERAQAASPDAWSLVVRDVGAALEQQGLTTLLGTRPRAGELLLLVRLQAGQERAGVAERVADAVEQAAERRLGRGSPTVVVAPETDWSGVGELLGVVGEAVHAARRLPAARWHDARAIELDQLLWRWREDPELGAFVRRTLGPLLTLEGERGDLLPTLEALCAHGGSKAEAARALFIQRQALYMRLTRIETLLGCDASDPDVLATLAFALRARRFVG